MTHPARNNVTLESVAASVDSLSAQVGFETEYDVGSYLGSPIPGVDAYDVMDQYGYLAGPLPWCVASLEAMYQAATSPSADIEIREALIR